MSSVYGTALPPLTNAEVVDIENLTSGNGIHRSLDVPPFDIEAIEAKNRAERDKRINRKGPQQFREATGKLSRFGEDVWAPPIENREPVDEDVEVLIIGCGHGGIIAAKNLHDRGIYNIRMVDQASDFGGVWYWNRYPGLHCDTESYIYLPFLDECDYVPSKKYIPGHEIHAYANMIADREKLRDKAFFQSELVSLKWNDVLGQWIGRTNRNDTIRASFVISAIGMLNNVHLPGLPGIEDFKGHSFHTARWDYTYTGGDRFGATLDKLRSKRIGLIGTGATTIQVLPQLAASGAEVYVFQRTPSTVDERNNFETNQDWFSSIKREPGWQDERCANFDAMITGENPGSDMIQDGWTKHIFAVHEDSSSDAPFTEKLKLAEVAKMEALRARVDKVVKKKEVAEDLKAWYGRTCKRPCFNDEYLTAFNLPNVHLVHTDGQGVESVNVTGVVANKRQYDLDCIIYATGFDWGTDYTARANMVITGKDGVTLKEKWRDGPSTLHGMFSRGFPNLLIFTHLQSSTAPNYTHLLKSRAFHAAWIISECMKRHIRTIEPDQEAEDAWVKKLEDLARGHLEYFRQCTPGYLNQEGQVLEKNLRSATVGLTSREWNELAADWRSDGKFEGFETTLA